MFMGDTCTHKTNCHNYNLRLISPSSHLHETTGSDHGPGSSIHMTSTHQLNVFNHSNKSVADSVLHSQKCILFQIMYTYRTYF